MSLEEKMKLTKSLLKEYETEGNLRKLFQLLVEDDPERYLLKMSSVDNFQIAKFGMLKKAGKLLKSNPNGL